MRTEAFLDFHPDGITPVSDSTQADDMLTSVIAVKS